jgi:hypothetical protein
VVARLSASWTPTECLGLAKRDASVPFFCARIVEQALAMALRPEPRPTMRESKAAPQGAYMTKFADFA